MEEVEQIALPTTRRRVKRKHLVVGSFLLILAAGIAVVVVWRRQAAINSAAKENEAAAKLAKEPKLVLACPGRIEGSSETIYVNAGVDGVLTSVMVNEGQRLTANQVIATIDCRDIEAEITAARAAVESSRQSRVRLLRGSRDEERRMAAADVVAAEARLGQARTQYNRITQLVESGDAPREEWEKVRRDLDVAIANLRAAKDHKNLVDAPPLPEEIAKADAEIQLAEGRVKTASAKLAKCSIKSPIAGTVLRKYMKAGESVSVFNPQPIISLADVSSLRVRAEVDERDVGQLREGQKVLILIDALPGKQFKGRVAGIGDQMGRKKIRTGDPAEKSDRDVLEVMIDLDDLDKALVVGLRVNVRFLAE
jgi:HlyD family secretion protein